MLTNCKVQSPTPQIGHQVQDNSKDQTVGNFICLRMYLFIHPQSLRVSDLTQDVNYIFSKIQLVVYYQCCILIG